MKLSAYFSRSTLISSLAAAELWDFMSHLCCIHRFMAPNDLWGKHVWNRRVFFYTCRTLLLWPSDCFRFELLSKQHIVLRVGRVCDQNQIRCTHKGNMARGEHSRLLSSLPSFLYEFSLSGGASLSSNSWLFLQPGTSLYLCQSLGVELNCSRCRERLLPRDK